MVKLLTEREFASRLCQTTESRYKSRRHQCVLLVSIDSLARLKRSRGPTAGQEAIAAVAAALLCPPAGIAMPLLHPSDIVGCHGESQLAVLLGPDVDLESATIVAQYILDGLRGACPLDDGAPLALSIGVAVLPIHAPTAEGLLIAAERAAGLAHNNGGRRVQLADPVV